MKKILASLLLLTIMVSLVGCGGTTVLEEFNTEATIEENVLYDENDIKITAKELTYDTFSAKLSVTVENNSDKELSYSCGSSGYHVNSINGYMVDDGYVNGDIAAGQSVTEEIPFKFSSMNVYGITEIADIEIGFSFCDDNYNYIYTDPLQVKTSIADSYDYSENRYRKIIDNGAFENKFNCKVNYFSEESFYNNYDINITSAAVMTNKDGEVVLLLEVENNSSGQVFISTKEISLNNNLVYESLWSSDNINPNKKYVMHIVLSDLIDKYEGNVDDISKISDISFTFGVGENWYQDEDAQQISISLPNIEILADEENVQTN